MTETHFIESVRKRLSIIAVGASALRNQGAKDIVSSARNYFRDEIQLAEFFDLLKDPHSFSKYLDYHTDNLVQTFAEGGQSWGAARKGLNLFFREVVYNKFLADHYRLPIDFIEYNLAVKNLEVPLDKDVGLNLDALDDNRPTKWTSIKDLKKPASERYQESAERYAQSLGIARVHLDLVFWRNHPVNKMHTSNPVSNKWNGYCPESELTGKQVRMRLNQHDFFESEATGLQICVLKGLQAVILNFRGQGNFRTAAEYADEVNDGEFLSPQNVDRPPFNNPAVVFADSGEIENYIKTIR